MDKKKDLGEPPAKKQKISKAEAAKASLAAAATGKPKTSLSKAHDLLVREEIKDHWKSDTLVSGFDQSYYIFLFGLIPLKLLLSAISTSLPEFDAGRHKIPFCFCHPKFTCCSGRKDKGWRSFWCNMSRVVSGRECEHESCLLSVGEICSQLGLTKFVAGCWQVSPMKHKISPATSSSIASWASSIKLNHFLSELDDTSVSLDWILRLVSCPYDALFNCIVARCWLNQSWYLFAVLWWVEKNVDLPYITAKRTPPVPLSLDSFDYARFLAACRHALVIFEKQPSTGYNVGSYKYEACGDRILGVCNFIALVAATLQRHKAQRMPPRCLVACLDEILQGGNPERFIAYQVEISFRRWCLLRRRNGTVNLDHTVVHQTRVCRPGMIPLCAKLQPSMFVMADTDREDLENNDVNEGDDGEAETVKKKSSLSSGVRSGILNRSRAVVAFFIDAMKTWSFLQHVCSLTGIPPERYCQHDPVQYTFCEVRRATVLPKPRCKVALKTDVGKQIVAEHKKWVAEHRATVFKDLTK
jgi:hypothetical protein